MYAISSFFLPCCLGSFSAVYYSCNYQNTYWDDRWAQELIHPGGNDCWIFFSSGFLFVFGLSFVCAFCFLFALVDITGYAMWTVSCPRLILGLVWEWDYCVFSVQKGFFLTIADILIVNSSSLLQTTFMWKRNYSSFEWMTSLINTHLV